MIALFFMIYALVGAAAGWGLYTYAEVQLTLAICGGAIITALLGQVHLFSTRASDSSDLTTRMDALEASQHQDKQRIDIAERKKKLEKHKIEKLERPEKLKKAETDRTPRRTGQ